MIAGLVKQTFLDYPSKLAATIFYSGCNYRCGYCHNKDIVIHPKGLITELEILAFLETKKKYLEGVCICGGEPLVFAQAQFFKKIKNLGFLIKLDTNGSFPKKLQAFMSAGLVDYVAIDLKADEVNYAKVIGRSAPLELIEESLQIASKAGTFELRTTILPLHTDQTLKAMGEWMKRLGITPHLWSVQQFITRSGCHIDESYEALPKTTAQTLVHAKELLEPYAKRVEIRKYV